MGETSDFESTFQKKNSLPADNAPSDCQDSANWYDFSGTYNLIEETCLEYECDLACHTYNRQTIGSCDDDMCRCCIIDDGNYFSSL